MSLTTPTTLLGQIWATDEDLACKEISDFPLLCPAAQQIAAGADGVFAPAAAGSWVLSSATVPFETYGVAPAMVLQILGPKATYKTTPLVLIVDSVSGHSVTLRRVRMGSATGQPPGPIAGLLAVQFLVATLIPQIENSTCEINRDHGIEVGVPLREPDSIVDKRVFADAVVAMTLSDAYLAASRQGGGMAMGMGATSVPDHFSSKSAWYRQLASELRGRVVVRVINSQGGSETSNRQYRIVR